MVISGLLKRASESATGRAAANFSSPGSPISRSVVAWTLGSYVEPQKTRGTSAQVVAGAMAYVLFDSDGKVSRCHLVGPESRELAIDIDVGVWHMATAYSERAVEIRTTFPGTSGGLMAHGTEKLPGAPPPGLDEGKKYTDSILRQCSSLQRNGRS